MTADIKEVPSQPPPHPFVFHGEGKPPYFEYHSTAFKAHSGETVEQLRRVEPSNDYFPHFKALHDRCTFFEQEVARLKAKLDAAHRELEATRMLTQTVNLEAAPDRPNPKHVRKGQ